MRESIVLLLAALMAGCDERPPEPPVNAAATESIMDDIGTVAFPVRCRPAAADAAVRGVVLLHHMMYEQARLAFGMAENLDAHCAMALWGQAMTLIHPLWPDRPTPAELALGRTLVDHALALVDDARERAYLSTLDAYFAAAPDASEETRLGWFADAWEKVAAEHPEDVEVQAFLALAHLATAEPTDKTYAKNLRSGAIAKRILETYPDHPGALHYLIHAYDAPPLAAEALPVADRYGALTPVVPHATHMMTHIYTRLGLWEKSIEWNGRSADSAWALCVADAEISSHYLHALDYLAYAELQRGGDRAAAAILENVQELEFPFGQTNLAATAYAQAAIPARYRLERRDWAGAALLEPRSPANFPWTSEHDAYVAMTHFARGIGLARLGDADGAAAEVDALAALRASIAPVSPYWAEQVEIQRLSVQAWRDHAAGDRASAVRTLREAAEREAATGKVAVSPGEVLPAIELLGDMLLEDGSAGDALASYEASLARSPGRLNSYLGAARAAEHAGDGEKAIRYYRAVLTAMGTRNERADARTAASEGLARVEATTPG